MSCGKYLVVCIVLCYVNIKRTETHSLPRDENPNQRRYRTNDEAISSRRKLKAHNPREGEYYYDPPRYNVRRPNYQDFNPDYREEYQERLLKRRPLDFRETRQYHEKQRAPPIFRNDIPPYQRHEPPQVRHNTLYERHNIPQYEMHDLPPYRHYVPQYQRQEFQNEPQNERFSLPPYERRFVKQYQRHIKAPFSRNQMHHRENIRTDDEASIPSHRRYNRGYHGQQDPPFGKYIKPISMVQAVSVDKESKHTVDKETLEPFEREIKESVLQEEKRPFARSDKFKGDIQKEPDCNHKKLDQFAEDQKRNRYDYPNDLKLHRRRQPLMNDYVARYRQPNYYDYDDFYRPRRDQYRQPYDNRLKYPNGPSYYQPKQYDVPLWIQGKRNAQYRNYFRSDVNKQATTDNEAKRNGKEENRKIMDKIIENYGKDLRAERENYEKNRMRTDININVVKMTNIDQEHTIQFSDSNINENQDLKLHEKEAPTVKYTEGTESVAKKDEDNYQDFTILITRRNDQHQDHFTKVKDKKAQYYASAATHGGRTTHSWLMEQYEGIAGQVDQEFEKFLQTQRDKKRKSENGENPERPQHNLKQSTTTARWFSNVDEKDDSRNSNDSSYQTTDTEKVDERPNRIEKRNSYEDYYDNKFKEMPPGPMLGQHVLFRHLQSPQCVQEFTITLPPDFSPPPNWKDSEELKQKTKRAPIILTRGTNNEKEQTVKHPGELNRSEEDWETFAQSYIPEEQSKENEKAQVSKTDPKTNRDKIFDLQEHPHNQDDNFEATYSKSDDDDDDDSDGILVNNAGKSSDQSDSQLDKLLDRVDELTLHGGKSLQKNLINKKKEAKKKRKPESFMYTSMEWQEKRNNRPRHARSLGENRTENETNHESIEKGELPNNMVTYDDAFEMYHNPHLIEENKDYSTYYRKRKPEFDNSAEEQYYKRLHKFMRRPISQEIDSGGKRKFRKRRSLRKTKRDIAEIIDNMTKSSINQIVSTTVKKVTTILDHTTDGTTRTTLDFLANFYKAFSKISPTTSSTDISSYVQSKDMRGDLPASNASDIDHSYYDILLERIRNIKKGGDGQLKYGQTVRRSHSRPPESCYIPNDYLRKHGHTLDQFGRVVNLTLPPTTTPRHMKFNDAVALMKRKRDFRRDQFLKRYKDPKVFMQETDEWLAGQTKRPPAILTRGSNEVTARYHSTEPLVIRDIEEPFEPTTDNTLSLNSSEKQPPETTKRRRNVEVFERNLNVYTYEVHCRREPTKKPTMRRKKRAANPISFTRKFFHHVQGGASNDTSESSGQQDSNSMEDSQVNRLEAFLNKFKMNTDLEYVTPEIRVVHNLSSPDPQKIIRSVTRKYDRALQNISMTYDPSFLYHWEALRNSTRAMNNVKINIQYDDEYVKQLLKTKKEREEEAQREKEKNKREKAKRNTIKIMLRKFTGATVKGSKGGNEKAMTETRVTKDINEIENNDNAYGDVMETEDSDEVIGETIHYRLRRSISPLLYDDMPTIPYQFPFFKQQISSSSTSTVTTNHPNYDENLFGSFEIKDRSIPEGDEYQRERDSSGDEHKPSLRISEICPTPRKAQSKSTQHSLILSLERSPRTNTGQQAHGKPTRAKPMLKNDIHYKHTLEQFHIKNHSIHNHLKVTHKDTNTSQTSTVVDNEAINSNKQDNEPSTRRNETKIKKIKHATKSGNHSKRDSEQALFGSINVNADLDSNAVSQHFSKEEDRAEIRHIMHFLNQTITEPHMTTKHGETLYGRWDDATWRAKEYERAMKHKAYLEEMHGKPTTWQDLLREKKQFEDMVLRDAANDWKNHPEKFQYFDIPTDDLESVTIGSDETEEGEYTPDTAG